MKTIATGYATILGLVGALALIGMLGRSNRSGSRRAHYGVSVLRTPGRGEPRRAQVLLPQRGMIEHSSPVSWRKRHKHSNGRRTTSPVYQEPKSLRCKPSIPWGQLHAELGRAPINPVRDQPKLMSASLRKRPNYCAAAK